MAERSVPYILHSMANPFLEGGRRIRQAGIDIANGGRSKRIDEQGRFHDNRFLDVSRAVTPLAVFLGTLGFSIPMVAEIMREVIDESTISGSSPDQMNWWNSVIGTVLGLVTGAIINAEHSRRIGRDWRLYEEEIAEIMERRQVDSQPPQNSP